MADEEFVEKTPLEKSRDIISQMKKMEHYARSNIEKLTAHWLQIDDELKQKGICEAGRGPAGAAEHVRGIAGGDDRRLRGALQRA